MSDTGFGNSQLTQIDKLVAFAVSHCHEQNPEGLDRIFDNLTPQLNKQVLMGTLALIGDDADSLAWFCGYFAGAINRSEDNDKPHSITLVSKLLIKHGMKAFTDFAPYPGRRLMILNTEKFETLPKKVQALVQEAFDVIERTGEEAKQINDALLEELVVEG